MTTTVKRITISLTKEDERQLEALSSHLGEGQSQIIRRAITCFYQWHYLDRPREAKPDNFPQS
jgi:predicted DNA-binding protein